MKQANQSNVGPLTIYKTRNEFGLSSVKRKSAKNIAKKIKTILSTQKSSYSITARPKRSKFDSGFCHHQALIQNYSNFKKSGVPCRFMFFSNDDWIDFSEGVLDFLKAAFVAGLPAVEGSVDGCSSLFDFYRMIQIDLVVGHERSIAWIDVNRKCFFPKLVVGEEIKASVGRPLLPRLEIEINIKKGFGQAAEKSSNVKEDSGESPIRDADKPPKPRLDNPCLDSNSLVEDCKRPKWPYVEILKEDNIDYMAIKNLVLPAAEGLIPDVTSISIAKCSHSGPCGDAQLKAFNSEVERKKAVRGNANVNLAWYGVQAESVATIIQRGFGQPSRLPSSDVHGVGIYLSPKHLPHMSASLSSADDNGERHLILCSVIVGNAEKVDAGSSQFCPSSEDYDCGVDDLVNPRWYIVWTTHMNRQILPKYVVSFKSQDPSRGLPPNMAPSNRLLSASSTLSFPKLFSEIRQSLPSSSVQQLESFYANYKAGQVSKDMLVRKIRAIAGDRLLVTAIQKLRGQ